jgi:multiple sugar transport system ATP-binding protein
MVDVVLNGVSKTFGANTAIEKMNMQVHDGEFVVLLGPTGAGKTTTLRLVAGLEKPDCGSISIGGRDMTASAPAARDVTFVFQQYSLYPHLSVYDNLAFPLRSPARRLSEDEIRRRIEDVVRLLRISDKLENRATQLSGGEMQRVAIGRALVRQPAIYLMDEPLSSLDAKLRAELRLELKRVQEDLGATILYVTHDQIEAMTMADRIGILDEGALVQMGTPREIYADPDSLYVAARLGQPAINLLPHDLLPIANLPAGVKTIGARTEHLHIDRARNADGIGTVSRVEHLGDQKHLFLGVKDRQIVTLVGPENTLKAGDAVSIELTDPLYFDDRGRRLRVAG